jgi:SAM-dependent MidA family methyltransferase
MGIRLRLENMIKNATASQAKLLEQSYVRLCDPKEMGEIYKILYLGHK